MNDNIGLALLFALVALLATAAVSEVCADLEAESPAAEVERCLDWCVANGWRCDCGSDLG